MENIGTTRISFIGRLRDRSTQRGWIEFDGLYRELLYRYARRRGAGHVEAEDIVQEVELYVYKAMDSFTYDRARGKFRAYLRSAVRHAAARRLNHGARKEKALDPELLLSVAVADSEQDHDWELEWQRHQLRAAMRLLVKEFEPSTLEAFQLHVLSNWSVEATAQHLHLSRASVYQAKSRVLKRLREYVAAQSGLG